jgi:lipoprotein signal peptidase
MDNGLKIFLGIIALIVIIGFIVSVQKNGFKSATKSFFIGTTIGGAIGKKIWDDASERNRKSEEDLAGFPIKKL